MDKKISNLDNIEKQLSNINTNINQIGKQLSNKNIQVILPQLEETNSILDKMNSETTQSIILQNDTPIQIKSVNEPTYLDYMTALGTVGAVIVSVLLGVIIPFIKKGIDWWKKRIKVKLQFIEYYYNDDEDILPTFFIDFKNLYNYQLYIKKMFFFIEFKGRVLPIILHLQSKTHAVMPPLSEAKMEFYISTDLCQNDAPIIQDEKHLIDVINKNHIHRNKISPFDKIRNVYLSLETNLGQFKINIPNWMRYATSDNIIALFMQDVFISPDNIKTDDIKTDEKYHDLLRKYISETTKRYALGKKKRKRELLKWKIEELCNIIPCLGIFYDKFIYKDENNSTPLPK